MGSATLGMPSAAVIAAAAAGMATMMLAPSLKKVLARMTTKLQLLYFDIPGLGEPIRFVLAYAGVPFDDKRFANRDEFLAMKPTLRFGQVPCLIVDGVELFQSAAILRYVARRYDASGTLYPRDEGAAAQVDGLIDQVKDMLQGWGPLRYRERFGFPKDLFTDEAQERCQIYYLSDTLPRHLDYFAKILQAEPGSQWLCGGAQPTIADFLFATAIQTNFIAKDWGVKVDIPPVIAAHVAALYALPAVKAFKAAEAKGK